MRFLKRMKIQVLENLDLKSSRLKMSSNIPAKCPLILLIGLPGSGKSYLAAQLVAESPDRPLISTDQIRSDLFGDEAIQGPWLQVRARAEQQLQQAVATIQAGKASEAIYDATNAARVHRRAAIAIARKCGFNDITGIWVDTPLALCLQRNRERSRQVPEDVILRMHRQLEDAPPSLADGLDRLVRSSSFVESNP